MFKSIGRFFKGVFSFLLPFAKEAAQTAVGVAAEEMRDAAKAFVKEAEQAPASVNKYDYARKKMKEQFPSAELAAINLAIEMAVAVLKDQN